jgi:hypothetical protein
MRARGARERLVSREECAVEPFGKRHVGRVVGGEVLTQLEDSLEQGLMAVPRYGHVVVVGQGAASACLRVPTKAKTASQAGREFDIAKRRYVKIVLQPSDYTGEERRPVGSQYVFDDGGSVEDDGVQRDSRSSRSARMSSAAVCFR